MFIIIVLFLVCFIGLIIMGFILLPNFIEKTVQKELGYMNIYRHTINLFYMNQDNILQRIRKLEKTK